MTPRFHRRERQAQKVWRESPIVGLNDVVRQVFDLAEDLPV